MIHQLQIIFEYINLWAPLNSWLKIAVKKQRKLLTQSPVGNQDGTRRRFTSSAAMPLVASIKTCVQSLFSMPFKVLGFLEKRPVFFQMVLQDYIHIKKYMLCMPYTHKHIFI